MAEPSVIARNFVPVAGASYKLMYLPQRNPTMAAEDFPAAWRSHSQLASKFGASLGSHFRSVHQCVKDRADDLAASFANDRDGCAILAMKSWEDLLAARYHPRSLDEMLKDEARVFSGVVDQWTMAVEEQVLTGENTTGHMVFSFLRRKAGTGAAAFRQQSRAMAEQVIAAAGGPARVVWSAVVDPAAAFAYDAVIEAWFADRESALAAARSEAVVKALEQADLCDTAAGVRLLARLNLAKQTTGEAGATSWDYQRG